VDIEKLAAGIASHGMLRARDERREATSYYLITIADVMAALNEENVSSSDPRAIFVGRQSHIKVGGTV
jgi:hypothetical protein